MRPVQMNPHIAPVQSMWRESYANESTPIAAVQYSAANSSEASGNKGTFCSLRILTVQAKRVWNPQVLGNHERNDAVQIGADFLSYQGDKPEA